MASITLFIRLTFAVLTLTYVYGQKTQIPLPDIDLEEWWGYGNGTSTQDTSIKEFKIHFHELMILDLKFRLRNHREFTPPLEGAGYLYGFNSNTLSYWLKYLAEEYPFKKREQFLNKYPHYTTVIQGLKIHFMRIRSKNINNKNAVPLLLLHGWPGSIREFYEAIPYLLSFGEAKGLALDIIVPSLPGFGFSQGAVRPGLGADKIAVVFSNLMHRIGYSEYYVQGGDVGSLVGFNMATLFSNEVKGFHTNLAAFFNLEGIMELVLGSLNPQSVVKPELVNRVYPLSRSLSFLIEFSGFIHIQATRPDTIGIGFSDSPSALLSYVLEKIYGALGKQFESYPEGRAKELLTADQILDNIMLYWAPNSMTTAMRFYAETINRRFYSTNIESIVSPVPAWVLQAPNEFIYLPPSILKKKFPNLLHETLPSVGGHFYAWERPRDYADDVTNAVVAFREWHERNSTMYEMCSNYMNH